MRAEQRGVRSTHPDHTAAKHAPEGQAATAASCASKRQNADYEDECNAWDRLEPPSQRNSDATPAIIRAMGNEQREETDLRGAEDEQARVAVLGVLLLSGSVQRPANRQVQKTVVIELIGKALNSSHFRHEIPLLTRFQQEGSTLHDKAANRQPRKKHAARIKLRLLTFPG